MLIGWNATAADIPTQDQAPWLQASTGRKRGVINADEAPTLRTLPAQRTTGGPGSKSNFLSFLAVFICVHLWFCALAGAAAPAAPPLGPVDFRYALPWWQSAVCLPDDPDKILVGKEGQMLLDFYGRALHNFAVVIQPDIEGGARWVRQQTVSARAPIMQTWKDADGVEVLEETFVVTPFRGQSAEPGLLACADDLRRMRREDWAKPAASAASFWRGAEMSQVNNLKPLEYTLTVRPGAKKWIVFGFCEDRRPDPGQRPLLLRAEGAEARTVDPLAEFGANQPGLRTLAAHDENGDGIIEISVGAAPENAGTKPFLNALWVFDAPPPGNPAIIAGEANDRAYVWLPGRARPERRAVILVTLRNPTAAPATRQPVLRVTSTVPVHDPAGEGRIRVGDSTSLTASTRFPAVGKSVGGESVLRLPAITLQPGETRQVAFTVDRHAAAPAPALTVQQAVKLRDAARKWWESADLPYTTVQVPDAGVQALIESSVRNIWQAREIKRGLPAFQVGPTVFRGLWVVDGSFLLESAAMLGRAQDARAGIDYLFSFQRPDGSFEILTIFWKENGIVLWAVTRHALLTQDKTWLRARWPALRRVVQAIHNLRAKASVDPQALDYRLLPPGHVDGGIGNIKEKQPEFSNSYWCLAGLNAAIDAAHWLGENDDAAAWQAEYDDFYATLRGAMKRDTIKDSQGNDYVPLMMANAGNFPPPKGQWAFCHAVYPGQVFPANDPLVASQFAMLRDTEVEGMVFDTGWVKGGIWNYFASFYGHAQLWQGQGHGAARTLYAFARHAAPTRVWREEQLPLGQGNEEHGDMPHNWASAEFIRLATHLIELDRGDELHLLEGFPREWAGPGMVTRLNGVLTPFGPLHLEVRSAADGKQATVKVAQLTARPPTKLVLHLFGLTGKSRTIELPVDRATEMTFQE
jgi:hypothetical protein